MYQVIEVNIFVHILVCKRGCWKVPIQTKKRMTWGHGTYKLFVIFERQFTVKYLSRNLNSDQPRRDEIFQNSVYILVGVGESLRVVGGYLGQEEIFGRRRILRRVIIFWGSRWIFGSFFFVVFLAYQPAGYLIPKPPLLKNISGAISPITGVIRGFIPPLEY